LISQEIVILLYCNMYFLINMTHGDTSFEHWVCAGMAIADEFFSSKQQNKYKKNKK
jgi:hypothetical protein